MDNVIQPNEERFFEYHYWESPESSDAELWYRSHQKVTVLNCENLDEYGDMTLEERYEGGTPLAYRVRFADGFEGTAMEDELMNDKSDFCRPDPPQRP